MSVKLRLTRVGKKKTPMYRVVVADERAPRDGRFIEIIGQYQPLDDPSVLNIKDDRALYWLKQGAQPSETVQKLLAITGVWDEFQKSMPKATLEKTKAKAKIVEASRQISIEAHKAKKAKDAPTPEAGTADENSGNEEVKAEAEKAAE